MAGAETRVMDYVRERLQQNPGAKTAELMQGAKKLDKSVGKLSVRQFHARYSLQIKRQLAAQRPRRRRRARRIADRAAIRGELLSFAKELLTADGPAMVDVIGGADRFVDRLLRAAGHPA